LRTFRLKPARNDVAPHGVGPEQPVDTAALAGWLAAQWGASLDLAARVVANAAKLVWVRPGGGEQGGLLAGGVPLRELLAVVQEVEHAELERRFTARWGPTGRGRGCHEGPVSNHCAGPKK
jgi:hypothetical protein